MPGNLIAIDVLLEPDELLMKRAKEANALLRHNYPAGFSLDESHTPHVTLVQRYIAKDDLEKVSRAVSYVLKSNDLRELELEVVGYQSWPRAGRDVETVVMIVNGRAELYQLQQAISDAVQPFAATGGTAEAFAPNTDGSPLDRDIISYVERFVSENSGDKYRPHVTVGFAHEAFLREFRNRPFASFTFSPPGIAIYQLGSFGTARIKLWS
jgi:2'-5' RNA ligase